MNPRVRAAGRRAAAALSLLAAPAAMAAAPPSPSYLYRLSDFNGPIPYNDVQLLADRAHDEVDALYGNQVRVFNGAGMQVYEFTHPSALGSPSDLAVDEEGDVFLLVAYPSAPSTARGWGIDRCDDRGELLATLPLSGLPEDLSTLHGDRLFYRQGRLFVLSRDQLRLAVFDTAGGYIKAYDLVPLLGLKDVDRFKNDILGAAMDREGRLLLTVPTLFRAFVVDLDGETRSFGRPGTVGGAFGVASGIAADDDGNLYVADRGRGVVMIFDPQFAFLREFGDEAGPGGLTRPTDLVLGNDAKLYVTQTRDRGVAIFRLDSAGRPAEGPDQAAPPAPAAGAPAPGGARP